MSFSVPCIDKSKHKEHWVVINRQCNYSAFNGYKYTPSDYSLVRCNGGIWRTKADYVAELPNGNYGNYEG